MDKLEQFLNKITVRSVLIGLWLSVSLIYGTKITLGNAVSGAGETYVTARNLKQVLLTDKLNLENQIASASSLLTIEAKAKESGFISNPPVQVIRYEDVYGEKH